MAALMMFICLLFNNSKEERAKIHVDHTNSVLLGGDKKHKVYGL
jgi:hypothetical protein